MAFKLAEAFVQLSTRGAEALQAKLTGLQTRIQKFAGGFSGLLAPLAGFAGLRVLTQAVISQEQAEAKLRASLRATGQEVERNFERLNRLATETQKATNVDDERIVSLAAMAVNYGLVGDSIDTVVKQAIGLERVTGQAAETLLKGLAKFRVTGEAGILGRALPEIAGLDKAEVADFIIRKAAEGMQKAAEEAGSLGGSIDRLKGTFENFLQSLNVGDKLRSVADFFQGLIDRMAGTSEQTRNLVGTVTLLTGALLLLLPIIPSIVSGIGAIGTAMLFLAKNPIVIAIAAIGALVLAWRHLRDAQENIQFTPDEIASAPTIQRVRAIEGNTVEQAHILNQRMEELIDDRITLENRLGQLRQPQERSRVPLIGTFIDLANLEDAVAQQDEAERRITAIQAGLTVLRGELERIQQLPQTVAPGVLAALPSEVAQLHNVREALGDLSTPAEQFAEKLAKLDKLLADNRIGQEVYADQLRRLQTSYEEAINPGEKLARELQHQIDTFGLVGESLALFNLGLSDDDPLKQRINGLIQHREELQANADAMKKMEEDAKAVFDADVQTIRARAEAIIEGTRTPLENFQKELAEAFSVRGIIGEDVLQRRIDQLKEQFGEAGQNLERQTFTPRIVGLAEFGRQFTVAGVSDDKEKQAIKNQEAQIGQQKLTNEKMDELIRGQKQQAVIGD